MAAGAYPDALAVTRPAAWRGIVALVLLLVGFLAQSLVFASIGIGIDIVMGRYAPTNGMPKMTPALFGCMMLGLATLTPMSMGIQRLMFGVPMRSLHSVLGRFRWRLLGRAALVVVPVWTVYLVGLSFLMPAPTAPMALVDLVAFAAISLLLMPFQAAGEEYAFRGLVLRIAASWGRGGRTGLVLGVVVSSVLFMIAHAATDLWLCLYYLTFGATLAVIAWRSRGLELPVLLHGANNVIASLVGLAFHNDMDKAFDRSAGVAGPEMLVPVALLVITAAVVWWRTDDPVAVEPGPAPQPSLAD